MLGEYLARVGLSSLPPVSQEGLREMHAAQAFTLPFENLSTLLHEPVDIAVPSLVEKIVRNRRGGYCFELNGLQRWALTEAGFQVRPFLARLQASQAKPGPLTHQISVVRLGKREWLCDVGFGGPGLRHPMPLELDRVEHQDGTDFRLRLDPDLGTCLESRLADADWGSLYFFHPHVALAIDIEMGNFFTSRWEHSVFRRTLMLARPFPGGTSTVVGFDFKRRDITGVYKERIESAPRLRTLLSDEFGIVLEAAHLEKLGRVLTWLG